MFLPQKRTRAAAACAVGPSELSFEDVRSRFRPTIAACFGLSLLFSLLVFLPVSPLLAWDGVEKAAYVGGSVPGLPDQAKGSVETVSEDRFHFRSKAMDVGIPWDRINMIEYGQRASRRLALAVVISPMFMLSKSRKHFLTLSFLDERDRQQALVFQLDKNNVRSVLVSLEARTGLRVEYQDSEARFGGESQ